MTKHIQLAVFIVTCFPSLSYSAIITFDEYPPGSVVTLSHGTGINTQGFNIYGDAEGNNYLSEGGSRCSPDCPYNSTLFLAHSNPGGPLVPATGSIYFENTSEESFSLFHFDAAEHWIQRETWWAQSIKVTGTLTSGAQVVADFSLDFINDGEGPLSDFQTFYLPTSFQNLSTVKFQGVGQFLQFGLDNINIDKALPVQTVPIPSGLLLFISGLFMVSLRRMDNHCCRH